MRSLIRALAGACLGCVLACLASGCGGGNSGLAKPPEKKNDLSTDMPGFDPKTGQMKTNKTK